MSAERDFHFIQPPLDTRREIPPYPTFIRVEKVEPAAMRYNTVADWHFAFGSKTSVLTIKIIDLNDDRYNYLLISHELHEATLCRLAGISEKTVDLWDLDFEEHRIVGADLVDEPGDHPWCPYKKQHQVGTEIEELLAKNLGVEWSAYGHAVDAAFERVVAARKVGGK